MPKYSILDILKMIEFPAWGWVLLFMAIIISSVVDIAVTILEATY